MGEERRPIGYIKSTETGKTHLPSIIRKEVGLKGAGKIPYYLDANCVLLVRKDATLKDILLGLDVLKADLSLRTTTKEE